jgi:hypothetical protein
LTSTSIVVKSWSTWSGEPPYQRLRRQVRDEHVDLAAAGGPDLGGCGVGAIAVPSGDRDVGAHGGQAQGGRLADACGATGDQYCAAGHRSAVDLLHG